MDNEERCTWWDSLGVQCELKAGHPFRHSCEKQRAAWHRARYGAQEAPAQPDNWWADAEEAAREAEACIGAAYTGEWKAVTA